MKHAKESAIKWVEERSPRGRFHLFRRHISEALGAPRDAVLRNSISQSLVAIITLLFGAMVSVQNLQATTIIVTNINDRGPGSLRQALAGANNGDAINFDSSLNGRTITLYSGELVVNKSLTINGPGANQLTVSGNNGSRVFHVTDGVTVTIARLTITRGKITNGGGGGIYNEFSTLTVSNCTLTSNVAGADGGGGIFNDGSRANATLSVLDSTLYGNHSGNGGTSGKGGGICNAGGSRSIATLSVLNSTLWGNHVLAAIGEQAVGGGIFSGPGGATLSVSNSTLTDNNVGGSGKGGGICNGGQLSVRNSTLARNSAPEGGGIWGGGRGELGGTVFYESRIFNASSSIRSIGYNLSSDDGGGTLRGPGDRINTNPLLGRLQNNGGPTETLALLPDSPAINTGDPNFRPPPDYDQRGAGFPRVVNGRIDIGSFEVQVQ